MFNMNKLLVPLASLIIFAASAIPVFASESVIGSGYYSGNMVNVGQFGLESGFLGYTDGTWTRPDAMGLPIMNPGNFMGWTFNDGKSFADADRIEFTINNAGTEDTIIRGIWTTNPQMELNSGYSNPFALMQGTETTFSVTAPSHGYYNNKWIIADMSGSSASSYIVTLNAYEGTPDPTVTPTPSVVVPSTFISDDLKNSLSTQISSFSGQALNKVATAIPYALPITIGIGLVFFAISKFRAITHI